MWISDQRRFIDMPTGSGLLYWYLDEDGRYQPDVAAVYGNIIGFLNKPAAICPSFLGESPPKFYLDLQEVIAAFGW